MANLLYYFPFPYHLVLSYMQVGGQDPYTNIKVGLNLNQFQYTMVTGTVFTFTNGIVGLGWGHLSDVFNRKWVLLACAFLWTLSAFSISFCENYA